MTAQVLLLHAQAGAGRDGGLYTDCTLAVWSRPPRDAAEADAVIEAIAQQRAPDPSPDALVLLPLARCTQGLSADERTRIDRLVRSTTVARHGPVRSVRPGLVLRLAFDAIEANARRRSGVMVREARLQGLLDDVSPWQASSLVELLAQADQRRARFGCQ
jgi:DNA ligase-1